VVLWLAAGLPIHDRSVNNNKSPDYRKAELFIELPSIGDTGEERVDGAVRPSYIILMLSMVHGQRALTPAMVVAKGTNPSRGLMS
jgi:hypothetical protein